MGWCIVFKQVLSASLVVSVQSFTGSVIIERMAMCMPLICLSVIMSGAACTPDHDGATSETEVATNRTYVRPASGNSKLQSRLNGVYRGPIQESAMVKPISVSILLHKHARNPDDIEAVKQLLAGFGATSITSGRASLSCKMSPKIFSRVFEAQVIAVNEIAPSNADVSDFGSRSGRALQKPASIPVSLADFVASVSIEPPAIKLQSEQGEQDHGDKEEAVLNKEKYP